MNSHPDAADDRMMTRREAIQRTALMLGVAISPSILAGVLQAQPVAAGGAPGRPVYLTVAQFETVGAMADRIIPRTDTPGAKDVGVPAFIDLMYGKYMTADEKRVFAAGIADVVKQSMAAHQRMFVQLAPSQQDGVLKGIAEASQNLEKTFFHQLRELTLLGYFSSEPVGKNVLHYDPIPGPFQACIPLADVGNKAWTR